MKPTHIIALAATAAAGYFFWKKKQAEKAAAVAGQQPSGYSTMTPTDAGYYVMRPDTATPVPVASAALPQATVSPAAPTSGLAPVTTPPVIGWAPPAW